MGSTVRVDISADLQAMDESGYAWAYLERAVDASMITAGATVIAGTQSGRCLARVVDLVETPGGAIVHLDLLPGSVLEYERSHPLSA